MIALGHALNLTVVAEGAETEGEVEQLRALGCDLAQGYYFARPMPADQMTQWMADQATENECASIRRIPEIIKLDAQ